MDLSPHGYRGLVLTYLLFVSRLVPGPIAVLGLVGYALLLLVVPVDLFSSVDANEGLGLVFLAPGGLFEFVFLTIWLIVKGFNLPAKQSGSHPLKGRQFRCHVAAVVSSLEATPGSQAHAAHGQKGSLLLPIPGAKNAGIFDSAHRVCSCCDPRKGAQPVRDNGNTQLASLTLGAVAGAVGTGAMDLFMYRRYKRGGGGQSFRDWELSAGLKTWEEAPAPAHVGKRLVEGLLHQELPGSAAAMTNTVVHWSYGIGWGALFGLLAESVSSSRAILGAALGPVVWASGYITLPLLKLYKPIWEYDFSTLARDFSAHAVYGTGTAAAFSLLSGCRDS